MKYNPVDPLKTSKQTIPESREVKFVTITFPLEAVVAGLLYLNYDTLNNMGAGGIVLLLPLLAVYGFVAYCIYALPFTVFIILKNKTPKTAGKALLIYVAGISNALAAVWLTTGLTKIFIDAGPLQILRAFLP